MVTKWKNNKWLIAIVWLLLFSHGAHGVMTALNQGRDYIAKNYFESDGFQRELSNYSEELYQLQLAYAPIEETKQKIVVTSEEIHEHRFRYGDLDQQLQNLNEQYEDKIQQAVTNENQLAADAYREERDKKIEDITKNFQSDEHVRAKIVKEKEEKLAEVYQQLDQGRAVFAQKHPYFVYRFTDKQTGQIHTNLQVENASKKIPENQMAYVSETILLSNQYFPDANGDWPVDRYASSLGSAEPTFFEGQIAVTNEVKSSAPYKNFQAKQQRFYLFVLSGLITLLISLFLIRRWKIPEHLAPRIWQEKYNRLPLDVAIGIASLSLIILMARYDSNHLDRFAYPDAAIKDLIFSSLWTAIGFSLATYLYRRLKETDFQADFQKSMLFRIGQVAKDAFLVRSTGTQVILLLILALGVGPGLIVALMIDEFLGAVYFVVAFFCGLPILFILLRQVGYFNQIQINLEEVAQGNPVPDIRVKGKSKLAKMAENVNQIKQGVKVSQRERAKSERLKTELITNVSHDLRTPLTSVITYTELLKRQDLSTEERDAYIEIIDRKSKRLKTLIDDLFEASKMASGSVELSKQQIDLVQLLRQALAEYDEQIKASKLDFRISVPDSPIYARVDGQKLWRAFENLIGNILNYSLENTRVYISAQSDSRHATFVFRNIAKYELGENADELFERFKRGDRSRQTEGSGLGLAIAKSIVDMHDGELDIQVDGDLFKVTIVLNI